MAKKSEKSLSALGRRERQIMEIIHRRGEAAVADVRAELADPPSYSAVRTMIRLLETKGYLRHRRDGLRYVYRPVQPLGQARRSALRHLLETFFNGSLSDAMVALLELSPRELTDAELDRLADIIRKSKSEDRTP